MADYKRLVSYIYNYEHNQRGNNVGFSRVESQNGKCKVTIHVRLNTVSSQPVKVYMVHRDGPTLEGIYFGEMFSKSGTGDFRAETDAQRLMGTKYNLDDICGVMLVVSEILFLGSQWDDNPLNMHDFFVYDDKKHKVIEEMAVPDKNVNIDDIKVVPDSIEDQLMEEMLAKEIKKENTDVQERTVSAASMVEEKTKDLSEITACEAECDTSEQLNFQENEEFREEENSVVAESLSNDFTEEMQDDFSNIDNPMVEMQSCCGQKEDTLEKDTSEEPECVERMFANFPTVQPFTQVNKFKWVKIEPKDLGVLPVEVWILANNSFLLHGYYNYRHLLFGIIPVESKKQYVIAVPGIYHNTEKTMAGMFGFQRFLSTTNDQAEIGDFGYWIQQVVL